MIRLLRFGLLGLLLAAGLTTLLIYHLTWHPSAKETLAVSCTAHAPTLAPGQTLKVMTWNLQYLAGKRYVFWYDLLDGSGPDDRPTAQDMAYSLDEVTRVIRDESPDIVLLQELDQGAKATDYQDQLALLKERLSDLYPCSTQAFNWKAEFVPDWHIFGSVGRKLATLSRYQIEHAHRLELPQAPANILSRQFMPKPALLVSYLPLSDGGQLAVVNTQLDDSGAVKDALPQVEATAQAVDNFENRGTPWLLGGDFNLLVHGQYLRLAPAQRARYLPDSDLQVLWNKYPMIPSNHEANGSGREYWLTYYPNDPSVKGPDRTLDYFFHGSKLKRIDARVRQEDTLGISNHLPLLARFLLPAP